jgi:hypothetical protein
VSDQYAGKSLTQIVLCVCFSGTKTLTFTYFLFPILASVIKQQEEEEAAAAADGE